jgi:phage baseplate assembly protein W
MAGLLTGDKQISGNLEQARIVSRKKPWRDLDLSLKIHPIRKDIIPLKDDAAIKNAVKNLLISNFFERPFQPTLGANLRGLLFEPADAITKLDLKQGIRRVLDTHEPRIKVLNIKVLDESDNNSYRIMVKFLIKEYDTADSVEIILRRLR